MTPERFRILKDALSRRQPDLTLIADGVHKTHNLAALARSCEATGVFALHVIATGAQFERHHPAAGGAWKWLRVYCHETIEAAIENIKRLNYQLVVSTFSDISVDYRQIDYTPPTALVVGAELSGVTEHAASRADHHVMIPMRGLVESLNVSVAAALLLAEAARQREAADLYDSCRLEPETWRRTLFEWCYPDIARRCREHGIAYPALDPDGYLAKNPFGGSGR